MKNKRTDENKDEQPSFSQREEYYRLCILQFQQLGYQEQYLNEIFNLTDSLNTDKGNENNS
ncbi:hypothetical protein J8L70_06050 [Pseudoalteromonas sp. MMG010]|uniref:hypothetical protein n=1 Tax=Pseudoalteromonas sp. MMG010 TaxID=2822685 RepID=UPI001B39E164|nr:hypothetical protein [Pseudoalteromonas sp. MMG010]MBQ4832796.1 hypothetical protein [Pseudoalteromonas sp. MMG010]